MLSSSRRSLRHIGAALVLTLLGASAFAIAPRSANAGDRAHWADGYVWAFNPTSASYDADGFYAFNRAGGSITITRSGTGAYTVDFAGLSNLLVGSNTVHVTGYLNSNTYCNPTTQKLANDKVGVRCFDATTGVAADSYYTVYVTRPQADVAYAYGSNATATTSYHPPKSASFNPAGGAITVTRSSTGVYTVVFTGLGSFTANNGGDVQVSALGTGKAYCTSGGWGGSPNLSMGVTCYNGNGAPADSRFNVQFVLPSDHVAYVWADDPSSPSYTPDSFYSSNPSGGGVTVTRSSAGQYNVAWSGLALLDGGDVQVTSYSGNAHCKVVDWGSSDVDVRCFSPTGTPVDSYFDIVYGS